MLPGQALKLQKLATAAAIVLSLHTMAQQAACEAGQSTGMLSILNLVACFVLCSMR
jgi:hypothetical protein